MAAKQKKEASAKKNDQIFYAAGYYEDYAGGGIVAVHPKKYSVATWSPKLNDKGNSVLGMKSLELLTTKTRMSIF